MTTETRLWIVDYDVYADATQWHECVVDRVTPKFVFCCGDQLKRAELEQRGQAGFYCVEELIPAGGKRITLAEQAEEWERRKADILAADEAYVAAERQCKEARKQVFTAISGTFRKIANEGWVKFGRLATPILGRPQSKMWSKRMRRQPEHRRTRNGVGSAQPVHGE
jgi:hypothetical protein